MKENSFSKNLKKTWNFLWHDDSILSWITFIVVVFIIIKFIFFPTLSFITGTSLPIVIVESCSMYHSSSFNTWWENNSDWYEENGINKSTFNQFSLKNGFNKGDIFFVLGAEEEKIEQGDTIIFVSGQSQRPIIHRVIGTAPIQTKGDNNKEQFSRYNNPFEIDETNIKQEQIIGKAVPLKIPFIGWAKLIFYEPLRPESERGFCQ